MSADNRHLFQKGLTIEVGLGTNIVQGHHSNNGHTVVQAITDQADPFVIKDIPLREKSLSTSDV